eukprot:RCo023209
MECHAEPHDDEQWISHINSIGNSVAEPDLLEKLHRVLLTVNLADRHSFVQHEPNVLPDVLRFRDEEQKWQYNSFPIGLRIGELVAHADQDMQWEQLGVQLRHCLPKLELDSKQNVDLLWHALTFALGKP